MAGLRRDRGQGSIVAAEDIRSHLDRYLDNLQVRFGLRRDRVAALYRRVLWCHVTLRIDTLDIGMSSWHVI
eukprot:3095348-Rhodomonas_salina.2